MEENIGFVFGGKSAEREISIVTMLQVKNTILGNVEFVPKFVYIDENGVDFYLIDEKQMNGEFFKNINYKAMTKICFAPFGEVYKAKGKIKKKLFTISAAVNCCHGGMGEDGTLAGFFKTLCVPFSSWGHLGLGLSMDKNLFRLVLQGAKIDVAEGFAFSKKDYENDPEKFVKQACKLKFPVVVKPNASGSSLGVNVAKNAREFAEFVALAFLYDTSVVVEKFVQNKREFCVAVVGSKNEGYVVSDVDEVGASSDIFSFDEKYIGDRETPRKKGKVFQAGAKRNLPADISENLKNTIKQTGEKVVALLGLSGISRVDFMFDKKTKKLFCIECNGVPGSLAMYFFSGTSLENEKLVCKLVDIAKSETNNSTNFSKELTPKIF